MDGPALDGEEMADPLERVDVKGGPANVKRERHSVPEYISLDQNLDAERFSILPVKGRDFRINMNVMIRLRAHGAYNLQECTWESFKKLELKPVWVRSALATQGNCCN